MNHFARALSLAVALATAATATAAPAAAEPIALDYRATESSCVDAGRFADEVSAKLGFVPWDEAATTTISVRVQREGGQFIGSFRNADGRAKVIHGASCADVTANLAVTVAAALDRTRPAALAALTGSDARALDDGRVAVTITSVDGRRVDVSLNNAGGVGRASDGTQVVANYFEGVCTSPCTARLPRGRHYLMFQDPDTQSVGNGRFLIDQPTSITLHHRSRRGRRRGLFVVGAALVGAGVFGLVAGDGAGGKLLGGLGLSVGGAFMVAPLMIPDTFTAIQAP